MMADELPMVPVPVDILVGGHTFQVYIEDISVEEESRATRFAVKMLCPHGAEKDAGLRMAHALRDSQEPRRRQPSRGLEKKLEEAIEHAKAVAMEHPDTDCEQEHLQLSEWLSELRFQRGNVRRLMASMEKVRQDFREFRRKAATSMDENVHIRVEISQWSKRWMGAIEISRMAIENMRMSEAALMLEQGTNLLQEVIGGFVVERERKGWEP